MDTGITAAITILTKKIDANVKADDALKYSQAALNLAHTDETLTNSEIFAAAHKK